MIYFTPLDVTELHGKILSSIFLISTETQVQSAFFKKESVQKEVKAILSKRAALSCEVADAKTEVKWYKDGKLLTSGKTVHTESKGKSRQLVIDSVEKKDAGEYICEAGTEKLAFKIHVEGKENAARLINKTHLWFAANNIFFKCLIVCTAGIEFKTSCGFVIWL